MDAMTNRRGEKTAELIPSVACEMFSDLLRIQRRQRDRENEARQTLVRLLDWRCLEP
jgi:hypothetical protein